ncbi:hypothetical protein A3D11_03710 [Candidatus Peribacteria bacterium RIFCSPHIGHO2_02_FULL_49_16]|nr:MAG: hypothetical protein A2880_04670 [Candidatus Peribacteria bacterium RIFCSPHIGHO2_01_FULL_49_38]OGJ58840.1 MAG: hypothetical protein A3D11_03710 [Candidatus Peribacteria bacterium RIFCSPHIGHO2_02_FULL_49_16]
MSSGLRHVYAEKALCQIPRLLSLQDRNAFSPTYGCFKRTFWLDKTVDFPDALPQFGVLSLTLAYSHDMPGNMYKDQPKMLEWILAGIKYWMHIQHRDGSFDEFYPNEHGWTGPTGFLLYGMLKSYMLLHERKEFPDELREPFFIACRKAAKYIIRYDEHGVLANHHAMAVLPVYYAYTVLREEWLREGYEQKLEEFLTFCNPEGWSLEYDGADIGYLSATVSFLGKVYKLNRDPGLKGVMEKAIEFLSYFVYPNGFYAGSMGSRNTLHFYSHGCEILAPEMPLAGRIADAMLESLRDGKIVPAEIMADRYFLYRTAEHLESWVDYGERPSTELRMTQAELPYERLDFQKTFPQGRFFIQKKDNAYLVANAAKGGVVKMFDIHEKKQLLCDCGIIGQTTAGDVITSQWIDPDYVFTSKEHGFSVSGSLHRVPSNKLFTPVKLIVFRAILLLFGWNTLFAYKIKGFIRCLLMLKSGKVPVRFERLVDIGEGSIHIADIVHITGDVQFSALQFGDEFFVRYVPQSRYFQSQEFDAQRVHFTAEQLETLNTEKQIRVVREVRCPDH